MGYLFSNCNSLLYLPDISIWETDNVENMCNMFYNCEFLSYLPDISKWKMSKVKNISWIFYDCKSLSLLPDISKWEYSKKYNNSMIDNCISLSYFPFSKKFEGYSYNKCGSNIGCISLLK